MDHTLILTLSNPLLFLFPPPLSLSPSFLLEGAHGRPRVSPVCTKKLPRYLPGTQTTSLFFPPPFPPLFFPPSSPLFSPLFLWVGPIGFTRWHQKITKVGNVLVAPGEITGTVTGTASVPVNVLVPTLSVSCTPEVKHKPTTGRVRSRSFEG